LEEKMKRLIFLISIFTGFSLQAQVEIKYEDNYIKINGIGPSNEADGLYWTFMYLTKDQDLDRITLTDISDNKNSLVMDLDKGKIYANGIKKSRKLNPSEYPLLLIMRRFLIISSFTTGAIADAEVFRLRMKLLI